MAAPLKYKSEIKAWTSAPGAFVTFTHQFIEKKGPNGGRVVIDNLSAHCEGTVTIAGAVQLGEDLYRYVRTASVKQKDGTLRYNEMAGDALRLFLYETMEEGQVKEHADIAIGALQTVQVTVLLPLKKPNMHEPEDWAMGAEQLQEIKISCANMTEMSLGACVVSVPVLNYWIVAECHEEMDIVHHSIDEVKMQDFDTTTESKLGISGRLQELLLFVRGAQGGLTLANLNEAWIMNSQIAPQLRVVPDLQENYARQRKIACGLFSTKGNPIRTDPFIAAVGGVTRAAPVIIATATKAFENPERDSVQVKTTQTGGGPGTITMIARIAKSRNWDTFDQLRKLYGLKGAYRVKTSSDTMRHPKAWTQEQLNYLPLKFTA